MFFFIKGNKIDAAKQYNLAKYVYNKYPTIVGNVKKAGECDAALVRC